MAVSSVTLANPRGFCAGVERAIDIVNRILAENGPPVYVKHEIVHNRVVVEDFIRRGVIFIEDPADAPAGAVLVFSAHGVSEEVRRAARQRNLKVCDATCPLVTKVHAEVKRLRAAGYEILMLGHAGHPEVEGTLGQVDGGLHLVENEEDARTLEVANPARLAYVTQTTLSVDDTARLVALLKGRFPALRAPKKSDICYATQNRQDAVKKMAADCDVVLVVGSRTSSNSNRLCEVARKAGARAYLVDSAADIRPQWLAAARRVGVTAGASAPEHLVGGILERLRVEYPQAAAQEIPGVEENIVFAPPARLRREVTVQGSQSAPVSQSASSSQAVQDSQPAPFLQSASSSQPPPQPPAELGREATAPGSQSVQGSQPAPFLPPQPPAE